MFKNMKIKFACVIEVGGLPNAYVSNKKHFISTEDSYCEMKLIDK